MKEQDIKPKYNRLFIKTYTSFAAVITVFALLLGVLYMRMYEEATVENYEQQLTQKAQAISKRCSTYFLDNQATEWWEYLILLSELEGLKLTHWNQHFIDTRKNHEKLLMLFTFFLGFLVAP